MLSGHVYTPRTYDGAQLESTLKNADVKEDLP
jgi:hypothetical protein